MSGRSSSPTRHEWTPFTQGEFLRLLGEGHTVTAAAQAVGFSRAWVYERKSADPGFAQLWAEALEEGNDALEAEARRRAVEGVCKPVFYQGEEVGQIREYSDTLLLAMLKAKRADYRDHGKLQLNATVSFEQLVMSSFGDSGEG